MSIGGWGMSKYLTRTATLAVIALLLASCGRQDMGIRGLVADASFHEPKGELPAAETAFMIGQPKAETLARLRWFGFRVVEDPRPGPGVPRDVDDVFASRELRLFFFPFVYKELRLLIVFEEGRVASVAAYTFRHGL